MLIFCGCASEVQFYPMSQGYAGEPVPLEDVQLFMELRSDGIFFINENAVDLWFSPTTKEDLFEKVSDAVISQT